MVGGTLRMNQTRSIHSSLLPFFVCGTQSSAHPVLCLRAVVRQLGYIRSDRPTVLLPLLRIPGVQCDEHLRVARFGARLLYSGTTKASGDALDRRTTLSDLWSVVMPTFRECDGCANAVLKLVGKLLGQHFPLVVGRFALRLAVHQVTRRAVTPVLRPALGRYRSPDAGARRQTVLMGGAAACRAHPGLARFALHGAAEQRNHLVELSRFIHLVQRLYRLHVLEASSLSAIDRIGDRLVVGRGARLLEHGDIVLEFGLMGSRQITVGQIAAIPPAPACHPHAIRVVL